MEYLLAGIIYGLIFGYICRYLALQKNKDGTTWFWIGFFLGLIGLLIIGFAKDESKGHEVEIPIQRNYHTVGTGTLQDNKIDLKSPVEILNYEIMQNEESGAFFNIKFLNLNIGTVSAIRLKIKGYNSFDELIHVEGQDSFSAIIQDLNAAPGTYFANIMPVNLPNKEIRKLEITVSQVRFEDGKTISNDDLQIVEPVIKKITNQKELNFARSILPSAQCYAKEESNYWLCACGRPNLKELNICSRCDSQKNEILEIFQREALAERARIQELEEQEKARVHEIEEQKQKDLLQQRAALKKKKLIKVISIVALVGVLSFGAFFMITNYLIPAMKYSSAVTMMKIGNYADAKSKLLSINDYSSYKDVPNLLTECDYQEAITQGKSGNIDTAIDEFQKLKGYKDSQDNIIKLTYQKGLNYLDKKDFAEAISSFNKIGTYKDSQEKLNYAKDQVLSKGIDFMKAGNYEVALSTLTSLNGYKNANDLIIEDKITEAKNIISSSSPAINNLEKNNIDRNAYSDLDKAYKILSSISDNSTAKSLLLSNVFYLHNIVGNWITDDGQRTASISQPYEDDLFKLNRMNFSSHGPADEKYLDNGTYFFTVKGNRCVTDTDRMSYIEIGVADINTITISFSWGGPTLTMRRKS